MWSKEKLWMTLFIDSPHILYTIFILALKFSYVSDIDTSIYTHLFEKMFSNSFFFFLNHINIYCSKTLVIKKV